MWDREGRGVCMLHILDGWRELDVQSVELAVNQHRQSAQ